MIYTSLQKKSSTLSSWGLFLFMQEIWKDGNGIFKERYEFSSLGRIKRKEYVSKLGKFNSERLIKEKLLLLKPSKRGYIRVKLFDKIQYSVHRLVAELFISNPENKPCVNHIDGNKLNNHIDNLEWCTIKENNIHAWKIGLCKKRFNINHHFYGKVAHNKGAKYPQLSGSNSKNATKCKNLETGKEYGCIQDAANDLNISYNIVKFILQGRVKNNKNKLIKI